MRNYLKIAFLTVLFFFVSVCIFFEVKYVQEIIHFYTLYHTHQEIIKLIQKDLNKLVKEFPYQCSFVIKDLQFPHFNISKNESIKIPAASLIKLPLMGVCFLKIKEGKLNLNDIFIFTKKYRTGGSGILKNKPSGLKLTLSELIRLMITYSDNSATNMLIDILGIKNINQCFLKMGLKDTSLRRKMMDFVSRRRGKENFTSSRDIAYMLEKIYHGKLVSKYFSTLMFYILGHQRIKDRLNKYLPPVIFIAHKTGLEKGVVHNAGIIITPYAHFLVCVLTYKVKNYKIAKEFIASVGKTVYEDIIKVAGARFERATSRL